MQSVTSWRLGHRPSLDVLRGVAILLVLVGHTDLDAPWSGAGAVGVSLFFALSGYLITGLLIEQPRLDVRGFYGRRARRLLPALAVFIGAMVLSGLATPAQAVPVAFYFGNLAKSAGFALGPFSATWSLAVEEQFYLLWPVALFAVFRSRPVLAGLSALVLAMVGLPWAGALLGGSSLAILARARGRDIAIPAPVLGGAAVGLAVLSCLPVTTGAQSVMAALSVLVVAGVAPRALSWRPLELTGRISYAMYLWHYPVALALWATPLPWLARFGILALAAYGLAGLSWVTVEQRFLRRGDHRGVLRAVLAPRDVVPGIEREVEPARGVVV